MDQAGEQQQQQQQQPDKEPICTLPWPSHYHSGIIRQRPRADDNNSTENCSSATSMSDEDALPNRSQLASLQVAQLDQQRARLAPAELIGRQAQSQVSGSQLAPSVSGPLSELPGCSGTESDPDRENTTLSLTSFGVSSDQQLPPSYGAACTFGPEVASLRPASAYLRLPSRQTDSSCLHSVAFAPNHQDLGQPPPPTTTTTANNIAAPMKSGPTTSGPSEQLQDRWISVDLNAEAAAGGASANHLARQQQQPDNNRANFNGRPQLAAELQPKLKLQPQPQQSSQLYGRSGAAGLFIAGANDLPINHVISAEESMRQWQANQYYSAGSVGGGGGGTASSKGTCINGNDYVTHQQIYLEPSRWLQRSPLPPQPQSQSQPQPQSRLQQQQRQSWNPNPNPNLNPNLNPNPNPNPNQSAPGAANLGQHTLTAPDLQGLGAEQVEPWRRSISALAGNQPPQGAQVRAKPEERQSRGRSSKQRKRRRHRSATSARSGSATRNQTGAASKLHPNATATATAPATGASNPTPSPNQTQIQNPNEDGYGHEARRDSHERPLAQSISAHCWLIDSSDEQVSARPRRLEQQVKVCNGPREGSICAQAASFMGSSPHLTVAMMRQSQRQRLSETLDYRRLQRPANCGGQLSRQQQATPGTSSLRMPRTGRQSSSSSWAPIRQVPSSGAPPSSSGSTSSCSTSCSSSSSSGCCTRREADQSSCRADNSSGGNAGVILRLSAILSMASRLVRKQQAPRQPTRSAHSQQPQPRPQLQVQAGEPSHISGSSLAPYTAAGSLAISSSSSTSAYATGSQSSSTNNQRQRHQHQHQQQQQRLLQLNVIRQVPLSMSHLAAARASPVYGSSPGAPASSLGRSSHAYEYCDDVTGVIDAPPTPTKETKFTTGHLATNKPTSRSSTSTSSSDSSDISGANPSTGSNENDDQLRALRPMPTQSDHELISAGSLERGQRGEPTDCLAKLACERRIPMGFPEARRRPMSGQSSVRRRWWWLGLKTWLRRPCAGSQSRENLNLASSAAAAAAQGIISSQQQTAEATAASYKSLRSTSRRRHGRHRLRAKRQDGGQTATLSNVISLAKADRAFRLRLVASVIVSCILLALICLLAAIVYTRSTSGFARHKFNLLVDDSDYDLSWLWPQSASSSASSSSSSSSAARQQLTELPVYRQLLELDSHQQPLIANAGHQLRPGEGSLRRQLMLIEQSVQLEQFQLTLAHLTSIQLANDNFIDIVQLVDNFVQQRAQLNQNQNQNWNGTEPRLGQQLQQAQHLVYVTLLSNLHWPLVKWRHQNQQSVASFLSAAFASSSSGYPSNQNLRNLLSLLILVERGQQGDREFSSQAEVYLLKQILRLDALLRGTSGQLINCILLDSGRLNAGPLRAGFCRRLMDKYRELMLMLGQLNHSHLAKLHSPSNIELSKGSSGEQTNGQQNNQRSNTKTLIGFFLDRLALLDVQLIAEETLAATTNMMMDPLELASSTWRRVSPDEQQMDELADGIAKKLIDDLILANEFVDTSKGLVSFEDDASSRSLLEAAKWLVGDSPANLNIDLRRNKDFRNKLQQLELDDEASWQRQLTRGILFPWSQAKLPLFVSNLADYDLFLHANLTTKFVQGMVKIEFKVRRPSRFLVLNCVNLNLADITLWLKQDHHTHAHAHRQQQPNNTSGSDQAPAQTNLKEIAIRRVLNNANLEQLYIELQDPLEPQTSWSQVVDTSGVNFGDLSISMGGRPQTSESSTRTDNVYVLSVAFNKTSLMDSSWDSSGGQSRPVEEALRFVHYGDYFAQTEAELKTMLYSEFEPNNGRQVFPCFDEPKFKARFQLNLVHQSNHQAISNGPKRERIPYSSDGSLQMSVFESSGQMVLSTYLVSFVIFDSNNIKSVASRIVQLKRQGSQTADTSANQTQNQKHIQIQILTQFEHLGQTDFAASLLPQLLAFYQTHLQFAYPLDKLDLVAIPASLPAEQGPHSGSRPALRQSAQWPSKIHRDSMENLGLILFRAPLLLVDINLISQDLIEQTSMTLAHQLAHQYFGNIITISEWGQDLWLFEGLCQYLQWLALSKVQPDWRLEEQFPVPTIQETLEAEQYHLPLLLLASAAGNNREQELELGLGSGLGLEPELKQGHENPSAFGELAEPLPAQAQAGSILAPDANVQQQQPLDLLQASQAARDETIQESNSGPAFAGSRPQRRRQQEQEVGWQHQQLAPSQPVQARASERLGELAKRDLGRAKWNRNSAILHMLLFNLLPGHQAQGRLLRACLDRFHSKTMNLGQFWRLFGLQLQQEASFDRLALDVSRLFAKARPWPPSTASAQTPQAPASLAARAYQSATLADAESTVSGQAQQTNERIVFVRKHHTGQASTFAGSYLSNQRRRAPESQTEAEEQQQLLLLMDEGSSSDRLADNLALLAGMWLEKSGYPLISVTAYRDRIHLKQEPFSFNWWMIDAQQKQVTTTPSSPLSSSSSSSSSLSSSAAAAAATNNLPENMESEPANDQVDNGTMSALKPEPGNSLAWWPIPLMFVSRYNPRVARFLWMSSEEMDVPYSDQLGLHTSNYSADLQVPNHQDTRLAPHPAWLKLNANQSSLVRVNYDKRLWAALSDLLMKSHYSNHILNQLDRANLIDDALTLMRCGKLSVGVAMNLTLYLEVGERDYMPWTVALRHLDQMQTVLNQNPLWHRYVLRLMQPISSIIGWKDDGPHSMRKLRRNLFSVALQYGDEKSIAKARQEFKAWTKSGRLIVPNLQELVYVAGVRYGDQQEWFHCWHRYQQLVSSSSSSSSSSSLSSFHSNSNSNSGQLEPSEEPNGGGQTSRNVRGKDVDSSDFLATASQRHPAVGLPFIDSGQSADSLGTEMNVESEKYQLLAALASTQNTWLIEQFLNYSLDASKIERSHLKHIIQVLGKNPVARLYLWRFVRLNWLNLFESRHLPNQKEFNHRDSAEDADRNSHRILETMVIESTRHFATKLDYDEVRGFFEAKRRQHLSGGKWTQELDVAIQQSLQVIQSNIHWRNIVEPKLTSWLSHFDGR